MSKHQPISIQHSVLIVENEWADAGRDGTTEPVSRDQILCGYFITGIGEREKNPQEQET